MKSRYVVIDEFRRDEFEKEWQLPYGYGYVQSVGFDPKLAIKQLQWLTEHGYADPTTAIVEKISDEGRELYYRI